MTRFLRYAVEHGKKIRAVFVKDGVMLQKTVSVLNFDESAATFQIGRGKPFTLPLSDVLSCGYARGDEGEETQNV